MDWNERVQGLLPGALAGLVAGIAFGLVVGLDVMPFVANLYGFEESTGAMQVLGWGFNLVHATVFGAMFAALPRSLGPLSRQEEVGNLIVALGYSAVLWLVAYSFVFPAWLDAVSGFSLGVPTWHGRGFLAHVAYGVILGPAHRRLSS